MSTKKCIGCKNTLPLSDFYKKDFFNINKDILVLIDRMLDCCEFKESLDEFRAEQEHYRFMFNGNILIDSHPTIDYSLAYR